MGGFWWQQTLCNFAPALCPGSLRPAHHRPGYWMSQIGKYAATPLQADVFNNIVLPHFYVFAPIV